MSGMTRSHWDRLARRFEHEVCDILEADRTGVLRRLVGRARIPERGAVLVDLGCGIGTFVRVYGPAFERVIAVDWSAAMVRRARLRCAKLPSVRWMVGDLAGAARRIGPVGDVVTCLNVITAPDAAARERLWSALAAATRRGGSVLVVVPSFESARCVERVKAELRARRAERRAASRGEGGGGGNRVARGAEARTGATRSARGEGARLPADGVLDNGGDPQKYFGRAELIAALHGHGFAEPVIRRVPYAWSDEGMHVRADERRRPWDWACLARRVADRELVIDRNSVIDRKSVAGR